MNLAVIAPPFLAKAMSSSPVNETIGVSSFTSAVNEDISTDNDWFASCSDGCGWVAAIVAALAYGTYGVPIKDTKHIPVHPIVLQSFKTFTMFCTCWFVTLLNVKPRFTPWGIVSGFLWVLGGMCGIYAIRMAGMAIAVGTWASVMCCMNFIWGILVFQEPVANLHSTAGAFGLLGLGLIGMSVFSSPRFNKIDMTELIDLYDEGCAISKDKEEEEVIEEGIRIEKSNGALKRIYGSENPAGSVSNRGDNTTPQKNGHSNESTSEASQLSPSGSFLSETRDGRVILWPRFFNRMKTSTTVTKRTAGILGAVLNGILAGSSLIPVHFAKRIGLGGANFFISLACGAVIANVVVASALLLLRYENSWAFTYYHLMPNRQHFRELLIPGLSAGVLLSMGMFFSIIAITHLGQGIGNSVVQSKIMISGLWGIVWFGEIRGCWTITYWLCSASVAVGGILCLSQQRLAAAVARSGS